MAHESPGISRGEAELGPDHPDVGASLNILAGLLRNNNRLEEAEPLLRRALEIDEATYGPDHPDVAADLNNLATLLRDTNRLEEAEPLMRRALGIDEASYLERALAIFESQLGLEHPNTAKVRKNLAKLG